MLRVAVSLSAVRTLNLDIISMSSPRWRCRVFDAFCDIFRAPPVVPELSAARGLQGVPESPGVWLPGDSAPGLPIAAPMLLL